MLRNRCDFLEFSTKPSVEQMRPKNRHYTDRDKIFEESQAHFSTFDEFTEQSSVASWKAMGAENFSKKCYVPGALFRDAHYRLIDAVGRWPYIFAPQPRDISLGIE